MAQSAAAPAGVPKVKRSIPNNSTLNDTRLKTKWPYDWNTQVDEFKILGITFSSETKTTVKINWQKTVQHQTKYSHHKHTPSFHFLWSRPIH